MITVAVLGTGTMGAGMARNILAAGIPTRVWNRSHERAEPLSASGAEVCATVAEAVSGADVIVTMLWDADSVIETLESAAGAFRTGAILVQTSTVGVAGADQVDAAATRLGLVHLDAPVLGTKQPAEAGTLIVLASGPETALDIAHPVFDAIGMRTVRLGPVGQASRLKLVMNSFIAMLVSSVASSVGLARALGLDPQAFLDTTKGGAFDSAYLQMKGAAMIEDDYPAAFSIDGGTKDVRLMLEAARGQSFDPAVLTAVLGQMQAVSEAGYGDEDLAAVARVHATLGHES